MKEIFSPQFGQLAPSEDVVVQSRNLSGGEQMLEGETTATVEWQHGRNVRDLPPVRFIDLREHGLRADAPVLQQRIVVQWQQKEVKQWTIQDYKSAFRALNITPSRGTVWSVKQHYITAYQNYLQIPGSQPHVVHPLIPPP